ncbi:MAG: hypothetical protein M1434_13820 [Chloroflexi bacterium]|nr:hypothetical protein [Chloroflexota bacterium]MCL5275800.1 hypothetical protein [Chloroflexota bacterium]
MAELDDLVTDIKATRKYRYVASDFIRSLGARELAKRNSYKEAVKATRNKLHQVGGAYLDGNPSYDMWLDEIRQATEGSRDDIRDTCRRIMSFHSSTRERLGDLDRFYDTIFSAIPPVASILDVACGFNPLAIPWMGLQRGTIYYAIDIYEDMIAFIRSSIALLGYDGVTSATSVLDANPFEQPVDLAFILKTIPCLEQVDKTAGHHLLETIKANYLVVTYPLQSLCGHSRGMLAHYEKQFIQHSKNKDWTISQFEFPTELVFLIDTRSA